MFFVKAYVVYKYEQDIEMFMYHQTKYEPYCHETYRDDMVNYYHHNHLQQILHYVCPNLNLKKE